MAQQKPIKTIEGDDEKPAPKKHGRTPLRRKLYAVNTPGDNAEDTLTEIIDLGDGETGRGYVKENNLVGDFVEIAVRDEFSAKKVEVVEIE